MCSNNVPVSHCKDTYYFDKINNYFKKVKEKETGCLVSFVRNLPSYSTIKYHFKCLLISLAIISPPISFGCTLADAPTHDSAELSSL